MLVAAFTLLSSTTAAGVGFEYTADRAASAWNVNRGALQLSVYNRFYAKRDVFTLEDGTASGLTVWDSQISALMSYGLLQNLQIDFAPVLLQKSHSEGDETDTPGDLFFAAKTGLISLKSRFRTAVRGELKLPTGRHHNIPLHPYGAGTVGFGGSGLLSLQLTGDTPERGLRFDADIGYFHHNDRGRLLTSSEADTFRAQGTQELKAGAAVRWMGEKYGFFCRLHNRTFITPPPPTAYSRENSTVLSAGFIYRFNPYLGLVAVFDHLLVGKNDETLYDAAAGPLLRKPWQTLPNYPDWRVTLGVSVRLAEGKAPAPKQEETPLPKEQPQKEKAVSSSDADKAKSKKPKQQTATAPTPGEGVKIEITDVKELERRFRLQKEQGVETEQQRFERMERERERMEALLKRLHERLQEIAAQKTKEAEEKAAEEAKRAREAEEKAAEEAERAREAEEKARTLMAPEDAPAGNEASPEEQSEATQKEAADEGADEADASSQTADDSPLQTDDRPPVENEPAPPADEPKN